MAEMEKEGRPPENKRSRKPAHPVKREINEEMKVFLDFGAREPELFLPPAPFGPLYRFGGYNVLISVRIMKTIVKLFICVLLINLLKRETNFSVIFRKFCNDLLEDL